MSNCYNLISCNGSCPDIYDIQGPSQVALQPYLNQLVYINGDSTCRYYVRDTQLLWTEIDNTSWVCEDIIQSLADYTPVSYQLTSFVYNGVEYITSPIPYSLIFGDDDCLDCVNAICNPIIPALANSSTAHVTQLNLILLSLNLPIKFVPFYNGIGNIAIRLFTGDSLNFTIERVSIPVPGEYVITYDGTNPPEQTFEGGVSTAYAGIESVETCSEDTSPIVITQVTVIDSCEDCFLLTSCDGSFSNILVTNDLSDYIGQVIRVCPEDLLPQEGSGMDSGQPIVIQNPACDSVFYLIDCCGTNPIQLVRNTGLIAYLNQTIVIPSISLNTCWRVTISDNPIPSIDLGCVDLTGGTYYQDCDLCNDVNPCQQEPVLTECKCFIISQSPGCSGTIELLNIGPIFSTCLDCDPNCYLLVDCSNSSNFIHTLDIGFLNYIGKVVKLQECPNTCWNVFLSETCTDPVCVSDIISSYESCEECLPPVELIPPIELKLRSVKPGYYTLACSPEYVERVSCNFANAIYNQMITLRYGLTMCCEEDIDKWSIKQELLDLKSLFNPDLCKCCIEPVIPYCEDLVEEIFTPISCSPPGGVEANISLTPMPCLPPGDINFASIIIDSP